MFKRVLGHFTPFRIDESLEGYFRSRMIVTISFVGAAILLVFALARYLLQGWHPYVFVLLATILVIFSSPWTLNLSRSPALAGTQLTIACTLGFSLMSFFDGGVNSPSLFGLVIAPVFGAFFVGMRGALMTFLVAVLCILALIAATQLNLVIPASIPTEWEIYLTGSSAASLMCILIALTLFSMTWQSAARERLELANKAKDEFLSGMSHELRTPLNSIMGFTDILQEEYLGDLNEAQKKHLSYVTSSSEHLLDLIEELLNVSDLEQGKVELNLTAVNPESLLDFSIRSLEQRSALRGVSLKVETDSLPETVFVDATYVRQILLNLLSNAVKFSPPDSTITVRMTSDGDTLITEVSDQGPGVPDDHREKIFGKFYQVQASLSGKFAGTGLGLYISRSLAELHSGRLLLKPAAGTGACFRLELPINRSEELP